MRKFFTALCVMLSLFSLCAFGEEFPDWVTQIPQREGYKTEVCIGTGKTKEGARNNADIMLKKKFAEKVITTLSGGTQFREDARASDDEDDDNVYVESSWNTWLSSHVSVTMISPDELATFIHRDEDGIYEYYILGRMSDAEIEKSREETKVWQKEEEQPYYAYKNLQILFRQAGKEKEFLQDVPASYAKWVKEKCLVLQNPLDDKKNSDWPGLFSEFLQKLFRSAISTNTGINDKPSCVVYDRAYSERIKSVLKRNGIKCVQDVNYLYIYAESTNAFRTLVTSMKNPTRIALYVDQIFDVEAEINSKSLSESLSKIFSDYLAKKDRELKCDIRLKPFSKRDFESLDARYAVSLEVNFSYTKREKKYVDEKQTYNLNIEINEKFFDSVYTDSSGYTVGKIEKSYLADSSKFKPLKPDVDFIITKTKDAVLYLSKKDGANTISFLVDEFLELM